MMIRLLLVLVMACMLLSPGLMARSARGAAPAFVGSKACADCHAEQYERFMKYSKKPHSWKSVAVMKPKLKEQELRGCYDCHTTGHGKPGGFESFEKTPHLAEVGCETCHGPGGEHAQTGDTAQIVRLPAIKDCEVCHNSQRVSDFNFKPLRYSGAH